MKQFTDITILLDRSGSMSTIKETMETAFNNFIKEHKQVPTTKITLVQFDDLNDQDVVYQCVPVKSAEKLQLRPRGNTPLLDALCKLIDRTGERLANMPESERPDQVLMVIITDGQENASQTYKRSDVASRVNRQRGAYNWQFVYLGANQDAFAEAASFGIPRNWTLNYAITDAGVLGATRSLAANTVAYTSNVTRGGDVSAFTADQRDAASDVVSGTTTGEV